LPQLVRGSSPSANRGDFGSPVSTCAISTNASLFASIRSANRSRNNAIRSGATDRNVSAASAALSNASVQSVQLLIG
jgi:hypothetical protein